MENIEIEILQFIQKHRIQSLDRLFVFISNTAYYSIFTFIVFSLLYGYVRKSATVIHKVVRLCTCLFINSAVVGFLKYMIYRQRPSEISSAIEVLSVGTSPSFPSGHTAAVFLLAFVFWIVYSSKPVLKYVIFLWAISVAYSRLVLGAHFPSDVVIAIIISMISALVGNYLVGYQTIWEKFGFHRSMHL